CCWNASSRSRVSRATFVSSRPADELRERTVFGAMQLLRATGLRPCALACSPPALERRRIAALGSRQRTSEISLAHLGGPWGWSLRGYWNPTNVADGSFATDVPDLTCRFMSASLRKQQPSCVAAK